MVTACKYESGTSPAEVFLLGCGGLKQRYGTVDAGVIKLLGNSFAGVNIAFLVRCFRLFVLAIKVMKYYLLTLLIIKKNG